MPFMEMMAEKTMQDPYIQNAQLGLLIGKAGGTYSFQSALKGKCLLPQCATYGLLAHNLHKNICFREQQHKL
jgi:hypothetical protein